MLTQSLLRRYRELICASVAAVLWLLTWAANRHAFAANRGGRALLALALLEGLCLGALFALERRGRRRPRGRRWITLAWASLPVWVSLEVVVAALLRGSSG